MGILGSPGLPRELAEDLVEQLPGELSEHFPEVQWRVETAEKPPHEPAAGERELMHSVRERRRCEGWDLAIALTDLPLRSGRRPVTAYASPVDRRGLVSVPALGAVRVERRVRDAVVRADRGLMTGSVADVDEADADEGRDGRIARRLEELASPLGQPRVEDTGTTRFVTAVVRGNLRPARRATMPG